MLTKLKLDLELIRDVLISHKVFTAITVVVLLFLLYYHPLHFILFLVAIIVSIEVGLFMHRFYQNTNPDLGRREKIVITGLVAGASGFMVSSFTRMLIGKIESLFMEIVEIIYSRG